MQKKGVHKFRQWLSSQKQRLSRAFRFRKGNLWDQVFRYLVTAIVFIIIGGWIGGNYLQPEVVAPSEPSIVNYPTETEISELVRSELQNLLEQEYAWVLERSVVPTATVVPLEPERPNPQQQPEEAKSASAIEELTISFDRILWPVKGEVVSAFGWQRDPNYQDWRFQNVLGLASAEEEKVRTVLEGRVKSLQPVNNGFELVIEHGSGWESVYRSLHNVSVKVGDMLPQNHVIGNSGKDGQLFFGLTYDGEPVDPAGFMQ